MDISEYRKKKIRESQKRHREKCKREHRCISCGNTDERTLSGKTRCEKCTETQKKSYRKWYRTEHGKEVNRKKRRKMAYKRISQGVCIKCGKNPPKDTSMYCEECIQKSNERSRRSRQRKKEKKNGRKNK